MTCRLDHHTVARIALAALLLVLQAGCALDSSAVLREVRAIERQRTSPDVIRSLSSLGREKDLADRVKQQSEDVVVEAYLHAANDAERTAVLDIATENEDGTGRYLPLLCYVIVCERGPTRSVQAAQVFSRLRRVPESASRSGIVRILGELAEDLKQEHQRQMVLYCLEEFLHNACGYDIPGAERAERELPLVASGRAKTRVVCSDPKTVQDWWRSQGGALASERAFDR